MLWFYFMVLLFWGFSWTNNFLGKIHGWREHLTMSFVHIPYTYKDNLKSSTAPTNAKSKIKYSQFYFATILDKWHWTKWQGALTFITILTDMLQNRMTGSLVFFKRFKQNRMINLQIFWSYSGKKNNRNWEMQIMIWFTDVIKRYSNKIG